jgi:bla regulator protein BlaR1
MEFQVNGGAGWIGTERYDITAKSEDTDPDPGEQRTRERMRTLLAERFQLKVHRDSKELGIYALVLGKDGPKLHESEDASKLGGQMMSQPGMLKGIQVGMAPLIIALSNMLERIVLDETGLKGRYDFQVEWTPDQTVAVADDLSRPGSIFTAVQEKLGLKLQSRKGPVPVIVVDIAERASEN